MCGGLAPPTARARPTGCAEGCTSTLRAARTVSIDGARVEAPDLKRGQLCYELKEIDLHICLLGVEFRFRQVVFHEGTQRIRADLLASVSLSCARQVSEWPAHARCGLGAPRGFAMGALWLRSEQL